MYRHFIRPLLFLLPPEAAHAFTMALLRVAAAVPFLKKIISPVNIYHSVSIAGLSLKNRIGLAAGFDKNARYVDALACLGFGFIEVGTVTPLPQSGNPKPRLFRLKKDSALINRMGFNNDGAKAVAERLKKKKSQVIVGVNIGKNKTTSQEQAADDYEKCFRELFDVADYFVVNVSSPNTPGLRELQEKNSLRKILSQLNKVKSEMGNGKSGEAADSQRSVPVFLKISPDLTLAQLDDIVEVVLETKIAGVIATNTTISRDRLRTPNSRLQTIGQGGLSGKPVSQASTETIRYIALKAQGRFSIIGCGGIFSANDAVEKINNGAGLVQVYTGFIYEGPALIKQIAEKLSA
jgi:dihydroorotate dehydrogenase